MTTLAGWKYIENSINYFLTQPLFLPISPHEVFQSEQWLSGNICSLAPYFNIIDTEYDNNNVSNKVKDTWKNNDNNDNSSNKMNIDNDSSNNKNENNEKFHDNSEFTKQNNIISDQLLEKYLLLIVHLACKYDVPGVIQGQKGIVWKKQV